MRANVYIRKENEEIWKNLKDKSEWVNLHLDEKRTKGEVKPGNIQETLVVPKETAKKLREAKPGESVKLPEHKVWTFCKHGSDPLMCKFAKPGKPCK